MYSGLASKLKPKERIPSVSIQGLAMRLCSQNSYRSACGFLNDAFHRTGDDAFKLRTLADGMDSIGERIGQTMDCLCRNSLEKNGFDGDTGIPTDTRAIPDCVREPSCADENIGSDKLELFGEMIDHYNSDREDTCRIKDATLINATELEPANCVYVSVDDVGVKHQKDSRGKEGEKLSKNVENTVIHVQSSEGTYTLTAVGMDTAFKLLLAFLLGNHLLENRHLYFFSDGASNIRKCIETYFSFCPYVHMLDWYHLEKKMTELLSMALKGKKDDRQGIRYVLDGMLWAGNVDDAIKYLKTMDEKHVKNALRLQEAIAYLERKKAYVCCYALRRLLGYRNSSNPAEKANDTVVAVRQKHNGMSWSYSGSHALAIITAIVRNNEINDWILHGKIRFSFDVAHDTDESLAA